jgi:hypothetical protein
MKDAVSALLFDGTLVDVCLSATRDQDAAEALFRSAMTVIGTTPDNVTADKRASGTRSLRWTMRASLKWDSLTFSRLLLVTMPLLPQAALSRAGRPPRPPQLGQPRKLPGAPRSRQASVPAKRP